MPQAQHWQQVKPAHPSTKDCSRRVDAVQVANPIADGDDDEDGDTSLPAFDSEHKPAEPATRRVRLRTSVRGGGVFDAEEYRGVVAESLAHLPDEQQAALSANSRDDVRILCEGRVHAQFAGKGGFVACWLVLDSSGAMSWREAAGVCDEADFAGKALRTAVSTWQWFRFSVTHGTPGGGVYVWRRKQPNGTVV